LVGVGVAGGQAAEVVDDCGGDGDGVVGEADAEVGEEAFAAAGVVEVAGWRGVQGGAGPLRDAVEDDPAAVDGGPQGGALFAEDGPAARINVRLPEQLKAAVEEAAGQEGRSVNAWLVRAAAAALRHSGRDERPEPRGGKRARQGFTGWVR
jgi:Ribbon-helix-helix protein, copG family